MLYFKFILIIVAMAQFEGYEPIFEIECQKEECYFVEIKK
jgi:hypothetical protein